MSNKSKHTSVKQKKRAITDKMIDRAMMEGKEIRQCKNVYLYILNNICVVYSTEDDTIITVKHQYKRANLNKF